MESKEYTLHIKINGFENKEFTKTELDIFGIPQQSDDYGDFELEALRNIYATHRNNVDIYAIDSIGKRVKLPYVSTWEQELAILDSLANQSGLEKEVLDHQTLAFETQKGRRHLDYDPDVEDMAESVEIYDDISYIGPGLPDRNH